MILYRVPMLNDYPGHRGNFIFSTMTNDLAYLDAKGRLHLLKAEIQSAILAVFMEREVRLDALPEFLLQINPPTPPVQLRSLMPIEMYVSSIERLARAIRGGRE